MTQTHVIAIVILVLKSSALKMATGRNMQVPIIQYTYTNNSEVHFFNVLLTVRLSINLGNDQLDTQLLYFTICLL